MQQNSVVELTRDTDDTDTDLAPVNQFTLVMDGRVDVVSRDPSGCSG